MQKRIIIGILSTSLMGIAQVAPAPAPQLSSVETLALQTVMQEFQKAQQDLANIQEDIKKSHPGYHFEPQLGRLVIDPPPTTAPAQPKVEPTPEKKGGKP